MSKLPLCSTSDQFLDSSIPVSISPSEKMHTAGTALPGGVCWYQVITWTEGSICLRLLVQEASLALLEDIYLGADLKGRAQLDVHGTHKMFFFKQQKRLSIDLLGAKLLCNLLAAL